jgi:GTPase SAR1 family protein
MTKKSVLPSKPESYPVPPLDELTMLVFGQPGTGKTTFCSKAKDTMFFATEPGTDFISAAVKKVYKWEDFLECLDELEELKESIIKGERKKTEWIYKSFVIDIVDNLANQCRMAVCMKKGLAYPPTNDFGKTWSEITEEWKKQLRRLMVLGNVRFISHCTSQEVETTNEQGLTEAITRYVPTFSGSKTAQYLDGIVNLQGYCAVNKKGEYCITFKQQASVSAKDRTSLLADYGALHLEWDIVNAAYEAKAKELGKTILSRRSF